MKDLYDNNFEPEEINLEESSFLPENLTPEEKEWLESFLEEQPFTETLEKTDFFETEVISPAKPTEDITPSDEQNDISHCSDYWHMSENSSVAAQEFIINEFKSSDFSESELMETAVSQKLITELGTTADNLAGLLECYGIDTELHYGFELSNLEKMDTSQRALVPVNLSVLSDEPTLLYGGDRIVEVVSADGDDVVFNDPKDENGALRTLDYEVFDKAWSSAGRICAIAYKPE